MSEQGKINVPAGRAYICPSSSWHARVRGSFLERLSQDALFLLISIIPPS